MPNIGAFHPQIVHFVIALLFVGVALRLVSLSGWFRFSGPAAATLILIGTIAAVAAVKSGTEAHGVVERIPGAAAAVQAHEQWGERTRDIFLAVAALELIGLAFAAFGSKRTKVVLMASALVGLVGLYAVYQTGAHGGELVYSYAGGPGLRTGNPEDVGRLYVAGLYEQAMQDRKAGRSAEAAQLIDMAAARFPDDQSWQLAAADSLIVDRKDPQTALTRLAAMQVPTDDIRMQLRVGLMKATAHEAAGDKDAARADLQALKTNFANNANLQRILQRRLDQIDRKP